MAGPTGAGDGGIAPAAGVMTMTLAGVLAQGGGHLIDDFFDFIGGIFVGDEQGIGGLDDDEVVDSEQGDLGVLVGVDDVVVGAELGQGAFDGIAGGVGGQVFGDAEP